VLVMAFSIPVAAVMTLTGGFLFGTLWGGLFANFGATLGSIGAFLMVRYAFASMMRVNYADRLQAFNKEVDQYGYLYLIAIRLVILFSTVCRQCACRTCQCFCAYLCVDYLSWYVAWCICLRICGATVTKADVCW